MRSKIYLLCFLYCLTACRHHSPEVAEALLLSGDNRPELEKVLTYYKYKNKVAYESACYLIGNMKYHESKHATPTDSAYQLFFAATDSIYKAIFKGKSLAEMKSYKGREYDSLRIGLKDVFKSIAAKENNDLVSLPDLKTIKADFLINNIESALKIWKANNYTYEKDFDFFKEFILPYRTTDEYPVHKRSVISSMYNAILTDSVDCSVSTKIERYKTYVAKCRWINKYVEPTQHLGIYDLLLPKFKMDCHNMTNWSCNIMRSNGIPAVYEFTPLWRDRDRRHFWTVSPDSSGILQPYTAPDNNLREDWDSDIQYAGKVYRRTFGAQQETPYFLANSDEDIPEIFDTPLLSDQTFRYHQTVTLRLPLKTETLNKMAYLCMFTTGDLAPVAWGKVNREKKELIFEQVPLNTLFFPMCYDEDLMLPIAEPFMVYSPHPVPFIPLPLSANTQPKDIVDVSVMDKRLVDTHTHADVEGLRYVTIACDTTKRIDMHLLRKYPEKRRMKALQNNLVGAMLLGSPLERKQYDTLLVLKETPKPYLQDIAFHNDKKYRYYRFQTADRTSVSIAHMEFLGPYASGRKNAVPTALPIFSEEEKLHAVKENLYRMEGKPIKTNSSPWHAFDNDITTYASSSSIAMDMQTPVQITHLRFIPRTANNIIVPGNSYLLLYYDNGWKEFKIMYAENNYLDFKEVPDATLFWLRNLTEGKEEFPFFYMNGKQYFLHTDTLPGNFGIYE